MKRLTIMLMNSSLDLETELDDIEILRTSNETIREDIDKVKGKYICFVCNEDTVSEDFFDILYEKTFENFDCCFINNSVDLGLSKKNEKCRRYDYLKSIKPHLYEYLWQYMYKTSVLKKILALEIDGDFDQNVDKIIKKEEAIEDIIYYHYPVFDSNTLFYMPYVDVKSVEKYKNIIYIGDFHGRFSGLITWMTHIGRCFAKDYDITFVYDEIYDEIKVKMEQYFRLVQRNNSVNYICDRFIDTYLDFEWPRNIFCIEESSTFIHGVMTPEEGLDEDLYDKYFAVSDSCRKTINLYFDNGKKVEYIHNPIKINKSDVKPHLTLVSTTRSQNIKGVDRLEKIASILDEEDIPYTWNVFSDADDKTGTNHSGFIYRDSVINPLSYVKDSDYLVMLSDTESFCYSVLESLMLNTKVVVTPLPVFEEIGVVEGENGIVIPFEYFEKENKELLREKVIELYNNKNKKIKYEPVKLNFNRYRELFKK